MGLALKEEVKAEYGISRNLDVTNFSDLYFGEILLLYRDVRNADGIKNKLLYIIKPPGWAPACTANTALTIRRDFLKTNPALGDTSKNRLLTAIRSFSKIDEPKVNCDEIPDSYAGEIK